MNDYGKFCGFGVKVEIVQPCKKGISAEIEKLEKQLEEKKTEKNDLIKLKMKLLALKKAWHELSDALDSPNIDIDDEMCDCYPFSKSFDEIDTDTWIDGLVNMLDNKGI